MAVSGFHDVTFPLSLAFSSSGGPERRTEIVALQSGHEKRNARWADSRRRWNAGSAIRSLADLSDVLAFFEARRGRLYSFRFRDPFDYQSSKPGSTPADTDQVIGTGDGETVSFQLVKAYGDGAAGWTRSVTKPVPGSLLVAVDGAPVSEGAGVSVAHDTGLVTFDNAPASSAQITAGYRFDNHARFDTDTLDLSLTDFEAGSAVDIPIVEVKG